MAFFGLFFGPYFAPYLAPHIEAIQVRILTTIPPNTSLILGVRVGLPFMDSQGDLLRELFVPYIGVSFGPYTGSFWGSI